MRPLDFLKSFWCFSEHTIFFPLLFSHESSPVFVETPVLSIYSMICWSDLYYFQIAAFSKNTNKFMSRWCSYNVYSTVIFMPATQLDKCSKDMMLSNAKWQPAVLSVADYENLLKHQKVKVGLYNVKKAWPEEASNFALFLPSSTKFKCNENTCTTLYLY